MFWGDVPPGLKFLSSLMLALKVFWILRRAGVQWRRSTTPLFMMRSATVVIGAEFLLWCYEEWYEHQLWIVFVYILVCVCVCLCVLVFVCLSRNENCPSGPPRSHQSLIQQSLVAVPRPPVPSLSQPLLILAVPGSFPDATLLLLLVLMFVCLFVCLFCFVLFCFVLLICLFVRLFCFVFCLIELFVCFVLFCFVLLICLFVRLFCFVLFCWFVCLFDCFVLFFV